MCEQCVVIPYHYGEVFPSVHLIRARRETKTSDMKLGEWGLVFVNDPFFIFKTTPLSIKNHTKEEIAKSFEEFCQEYYENVMFDSTIHLYNAYSDLAVIAKENETHNFTYDDDKVNCMWNERNLGFIYCSIADLIETSDPVPEEDPFPNLIDGAGVKNDLTYDPKVVMYVSDENDRDVVDENT